MPDDTVSLLAPEKRELLRYWAIVGMCVGWAILYSLPVVLTTITSGNRRMVRGPPRHSAQPAAPPGRPPCRAVITTVLIAPRRRRRPRQVFELQEAYRKYLWFMSGAGFLTVLKARPARHTKSTAVAEPSQSLARCRAGRTIS